MRQSHSLQNVSKDLVLKDSKSKFLWRNLHLSRNFWSNIDVRNMVVSHDCVTVHISRIKHQKDMKINKAQVQETFHAFFLAPFTCPAHDERISYYLHVTRFTDIKSSKRIEFHKIHLSPKKDNRHLSTICLISLDLSVREILFHC